MQSTKQTLTEAMVWGPNLGINYPFTSPSALVQLPAPGTPDFLAMDTNGNGRIDGRDDPYLPYYPGDAFVDWVALSLYWYPDANTGFNIPPPPTYFRDMLTSTGPSMALVNEEANGDPTRNFYQRFCVERGKPLMIPETASPWFEDQPSTFTQVQVKGGWYQQIFSVENMNLFPMLKVVTTFEERKRDAGAAVRDWRVLADAGVKRGFEAVLADAGKRVIYGSGFTYSCGGVFVPR